LHQAVHCNHLARARQQLNAGADANELEEPRYGERPLEIAIELDSTDMVALLLEFGADPNQQDPSFQGTQGMHGGNTSLHAAVYKGSAKMVKLLLAHGADPDIANADGANPIELAQRTSHTHLAHLMEAHIDKKLSLEVSQTAIEPLYTVQKVAELLSVDDAFILELIKTRKITGLHLDEKTLRITAGSVQRYLAKLANK
jgi:ankyrin repeat protein